MAKQIAHEIKNPLTPMKLNIQFLQRTQNIHSPDYVEKMNRITDTLIEQIDNLSSIATEFSNFAKMPNAKNTLFDPARRTHDTVNLYAETGQSQIVVEFDLESKIRVNADKEQFSRALINLIRNAIQAIPQSREGRIRIQMKDFGTNVEISISDNGKGIPSDLCDKIFVPNFTTKSSGAGLGLAITKNIIESFGVLFRFRYRFTNTDGCATTVLFFRCFNPPVWSSWPWLKITVSTVSRLMPICWAFQRNKSVLPVSNR